MKRNQRKAFLHGNLMLANRRWRSRKILNKLIEVLDHRAGDFAKFSNANASRAEQRCLTTRQALFTITLRRILSPKRK